MAILSSGLEQPGLRSLRAVRGAVWRRGRTGNSWGFRVDRVRGSGFRV